MYTFDPVCIEKIKNKFKLLRPLLFFFVLFFKSLTCMPYNHSSLEKEQFKEMIKMNYHDIHAHECI